MYKITLKVNGDFYNGKYLIKIPITYLRNSKNEKNHLQRI
jgi:hypothetical protein